MLATMFAEWSLALIVRSFSDKHAYSRFIKIEFGVRHGSVLAPSLFAVYIDDVVSRLSLSQRYFIILYADDILMISVYHQHIICLLYTSDAADE